MGAVLVGSGDIAANSGTSGSAQAYGSTSARHTNLAEASVGFPMPAPGVFSRLTAAHGAVSGTWGLTFRKNGANGNQAISNTAVSDITDTDTVAQGDVVNLLWGAGGGAVQRVQGIFQATSGHWALYGAGDQGTGRVYSAATVYYPSLAASLGSSTVESSTQASMGAPGTASQMFIDVIANATTAPSTLVFRKTGVSGNQTVTIPAGQTGRFTDPVNTDSVATGDLDNFMLTVGAGGALTVGAIGVGFEGSAGSNDVVGTNGNVLSGVTYQCLYGASTTGATEAAQQIAHHFAVQLSRLAVLVSANSATAASTVVTRINGANGTITVTIPAGQTGWFVGTGLDIAGPADLVDLLITPGSGGSLTVTRTVLTESPYNLSFALATTPVPTLKKQGRKQLAPPFYNGAGFLALEPLNSLITDMEGVGFDGRYLYVTPHDSQIIAKIDPRLFPASSGYLGAMSLASFGNPFAYSCVVVGNRWLYVLPHASSGVAKLIVLQIDLTLWNSGPSAAVTEMDLSTILPQDPRGPAGSAACSGGGTDGTWLYLTAGGQAKNSPAGIPSLIRIGTGANFSSANVTSLNLSTLAGGITGVGGPLAFDGRYIYGVGSLGIESRVNAQSIIFRVDTQNFDLAHVITSAVYNYTMGAFATDGTNVWAAPGLNSTPDDGSFGPMYQLSCVDLSLVNSFNIVGVYGNTLAQFASGAGFYDGSRYFYFFPGNASASTTKVLVVDGHNPGQVTYFDLASIDPNAGGYAGGQASDGLYLYAVPFLQAASALPCNLIRFQLLSPTASPFPTTIPIPSLVKRGLKALPIPTSPVPSLVKRGLKALVLATAPIPSLIVLLVQFLKAVASDLGNTINAALLGNVYPWGNVVTMIGTFTAQDGVTPEDPPGVTLYVGSPSGAVTEYTYAANQLTRNGPGNYQMIFLPDAPGIWTYAFGAAGGTIVSVATADTRFVMLPSAIIPGAS